MQFNDSTLFSVHICGLIWKKRIWYISPKKYIKCTTCSQSKNETTKCERSIPLRIFLKSTYFLIFEVWKFKHLNWCLSIDGSSIQLNCLSKYWHHLYRNRFLKKGRVNIWQIWNAHTKKGQSIDWNKRDGTYWITFSNLNCTLKRFVIINNVYLCDRDTLH